MSDVVLSPRAREMTQKVSRRYFEALAQNSADALTFSTIGGTGYVVVTGTLTATARAIVGVGNRTTVTNGTGVAGNTVVDISATYPGQSTITTLGTVTTGTWQGTPIGNSYLANSAVANLSGTNTGDQTITLTGDITGSGTGSFATTLATVNSNVGSFGDGTHVAAVTVNAKGLVTAASSVAITGAAPTGSAGGDLSGTYPNPTVAKVAGTTPTAGIVTFLGTPSSANLASAVTDETGSGALVFATSPTLVTPLLGTPTSGTLTNCTGYTDANLSTSDITTNNASTSKHGFAPKYPNDATKYLDGTGAYSTPTGTGGTVNSGTAGQLAYYATSAAAVSGFTVPSASAYNSTATTLAASAFTKVTLGTELFDTGSYFDTVNSKYVPLIAGVYQVNFNIGFNGSVAAATLYGCALYKNGSAYKRGQFTNTATAGSGIEVHGSCIVNMNGSTDYLELYAFNGHASSTLDTNNDQAITYITFVWVGQ